MGITARRLMELGLIDNIISEPLGGAHRFPEEMAANLKKTLVEQLRVLESEPQDKRMQARFDKLMSYGIHE